MTVLTEIDHEAQALSRLITQYRESPKLIAFVQALMAQSQQAEQAFLQLAYISDIDASEGVQLDVIGAIVGISRYVKDAIPVAFFGFTGQPGTRSLGEEGIPDVGGEFREELQPAFAAEALSDAQYRLFIRARIARNHTRGTIQDVVTSMTFLFDAPVVLVHDGQDMSFDIGIGRRLSYSEQVLLFLREIIPKPAGVRINERVFFDYQNVFGFEGQPYAIGFGDEDQFFTVTLPATYDGSFDHDGSRVYDGVGQTIRTYDPPLIGGVFAEEFTI